MDRRSPKGEGGLVAASYGSASHLEKDTMPLEMRPICEKCGKPLALDSAEARICSYECTFCASCTDAMNGRCPNCGGELQPRPRRIKK